MKFLLITLLFLFSLNSFSFMSAHRAKIKTLKNQNYKNKECEINYIKSIKREIIRHVELGDCSAGYDLSSCDEEKNKENVNEKAVKYFKYLGYKVNYREEQPRFNSISWCEK